MLRKDTEPLALSVYADGTVLITEGLGSLSEPLPTVTVGRIANCMVDWAVAETDRVISLDMGQAMVTDQGTTVVTLSPPDRPHRSLSEYALGVGDDHVPEPAQTANRGALLATSAAMRGAVGGRAPWSPDRLELTPTTAGKNIPRHLWPGPVMLSTLLSQKASSGCVIVTGETATRVVAEIGTDPVLAEWSDRGAENVAAGTNVLGVLLPGQPPTCGR